MGDKLTETDVVRLVGAASPLVVHEVLRSGASVGELRRAVAFAASARLTDARVPPRIRRLVDLVVAAEGEPPTGCAA